MSTKNGKCTLSTDLKRVAVRVPSRYKTPLEDDESFDCRSSLHCTVSDASDPLSNGVDVWYEINGGGYSAAFVDTKNGNVWAGFVKDEEVGCWTSCSVL